MIRAGIYNRCSTEEEAQINALEIQAEESREIVEGKGWVIAEQYIESESGTTSHRRSEYQRLLEDMKTDKFNIVVIKSIDRLTRSAKDWYVFLDQLTQNRKKLYIYIDHKFYTPEDSLITGIKAILAEDFSRELSKKIKNAHRRRQDKKSGLNITSPMFGWDKMGKNRFVINEEEAAAYRYAFELAREGKGFHRIAKMMYENGVRSKSGKRLGETQWRNMLYSPRAHGTVVLHTTEYDFETKKRVKLPESEWIYVENALPPIVNKEYQDEILQILKERRKKRDWQEVGLYELSGKLYCAECSGKYYRVAFESGGRLLREWKCSTMLHQGRKTTEHPLGCNNRNVLEDVILKTIEESCSQYYEKYFGSKQAITQEAKTAIKSVLQQNTAHKELMKRKKELEKLKQKKNVLFHKLMEEVIGDAEFQEMNQALSETMEGIETQIRTLEKKMKECNLYEERWNKIETVLQETVVAQAMTGEFLRQIDKIMIYPDGELEIFLDEMRIHTTYEHKSSAERRREQVNAQILELFRGNPNLMLKNVPKLVGMGESYVNTSVKMLKENGLLKYERNGNTHTGRWIVNEISGHTV